MKASHKKTSEELITITQVIINKGLRRKVSEPAKVIKNLMSQVISKPRNL